MSAQDILSELRQSLKDFWNDCNNEKESFEQEYMKIFADVWRDSVIIYNKEQEIPPAEHANNEEEEEEQVVTEEILEEADIRHEAILVTVTKKRKEYPKRIAAYLGKRRRLQKNTAEIMKVELPPRIPIEVDEKVYDMSDNTDTESSPSSSLSESIKQLQPHVQRLVNLADAACLLKNIQRESDVESPNSKSL